MTARRAYGIAAAVAFASGLLIALGHRISTGGTR